MVSVFVVILLFVLGVFVVITLLFVLSVFVVITLFVLSLFVVISLFVLSCFVVISLFVLSLLLYHCCLCSEMACTVVTNHISFNGYYKLVFLLSKGSLVSQTCCV